MENLNIDKYRVDKKIEEKSGSENYDINLEGGEDSEEGGPEGEEVAELDDRKEGENILDYERRKQQERK